MSGITDQAASIAALLDQCGLDVDVVYPSPPANLDTKSAVVVPAPDWGSFDGATFCGPRVSWEIILVASITDFGAAMDWFFEQVSILAAVDELEVASWQQPELIQLGAGQGGEALAVRVQLAPRTLEI